MKTKTALLLCCACYAWQAGSQSLRDPMASAYIQMGAYSSVGQSPFSFTGNTAALARVKQSGFGIYGERRFMLAPIGMYQLCAVLPSSLGKFGIAVNYAGFKNFSENSFGLAYGKSLGKRLDLGIRFNYYGYHIPAYPGGAAVNVDIGAMVHITRNCQFGIQVNNPMPVSLGKARQEKLPSTYRFGMGYDSGERFYTGAEIVKETDKPVNIRASANYRFARILFAALGISSDNGSLFGGAGLAWNNMRLDLSVSYHPQLGFTPGILLIMQQKPKQP